MDASLLERYGTSSSDPSEFESVFNPESNRKDSLEHPKSSAAEQNKFLKHIKAMCDLANEGKVVNPFRETGPELITLDTG